MTRECFGCGKQLGSEGHPLYADEYDEQPISDVFGCDEYPECIDGPDGDTWPEEEE